MSRVDFELTQAKGAIRANAYTTGSMRKAEQDHVRICNESIYSLIFNAYIAGYNAAIEDAENERDRFMVRAVSCARCSQPTVHLDPNFIDEMLCDECRLHAELAGD